MYDYYIYYYILTHLNILDTSGVLMFAKNEVIKNKLQNNWNTIVSKRGYLAIVEGKLRKKHGTIKNWISYSTIFFISNNAMS